MEIRNLGEGGPEIHPPSRRLNPSQSESCRTLAELQNSVEICDAVPKAGSLTHQHLLAVVNTELALRSPSNARPVRILDAGCGDGLLLEFLSKALPACWPNCPFEFFGFDVSDHGVQKSGFLTDTIERLTRSSPYHPWGKRIASISNRDSWPYESGTFDVVVSNQVVEHVFNHELFFHEIARVLRVGGFSAHLFPLWHCIREPHLHIPFAHWLRSSEAITSYIKMCSSLGIGKFRKTTREDCGLHSLHDYAKRHADYIIRNTNYLTQRNVFDIVKPTKLHASFRYSGHYYTEKLRSLAGRRPAAFYGSWHPLSSCGVTLLRYVASITLLLEKEESYQA